MPQLLQRPAEDDTQLETGQCVSVRERFLSLDAGQEVEVVDVSEETVADGEFPEHVTLQLTGVELPSLIEPAVMDYHGSDIKQAVDNGTLELQ